MKKLIMTIAITLTAISSFAAPKCQKCNDIGFRFEFETCRRCEGKGTVSRQPWRRVLTSRCPECGKLGNKLGKVKVKHYCDCKIGKAKKERDEKPRKMTLK